ncbi:putative invertase inhibitor [Papaver somniferum]|uniref:putative invertase inhibitor n=1 Tax=Papaver somniferum TaxID=3469 RepID=UPI000E6FC689|nr:putative invertase inhibitor [Papaver somniferum]
MTKATQMYNQASSLILKAPDAQKGPLNYCMARYNSAIVDIDAAGNFFRSKNYVKLNKISIRIASDANKCEGSFKYSPSNPSPITQQNRDFYNLVDVLTATSYLLSH